ERDRKAMIEWVIRELDLIFDTELKELKRGKQQRDEEKLQRLLAWAKTDGLAIAAAKHGNIEPLRKKYPRLAKFLFLPKGTRSPKPPKDAFSPAIAVAADDVRR